MRDKIAKDSKLQFDYIWIILIIKIQNCVYLSSIFFPSHEVGITFIILFLLSDTVSYIFISSWHHIPEISLDSLGPPRKILL